MTSPNSIPGVDETLSGKNRMTRILLSTTSPNRDAASVDTEAAVGAGAGAAAGVTVGAGVAAGAAAAARVVACLVSWIRL